MHGRGIHDGEFLDWTGSKVPKLRPNSTCFFVTHPQLVVTIPAG
jgi:hypothetical protein